MVNYFVTTNGGVSYQQFASFARSELWKADGLYAIQWAPRILGVDRVAFEANMTAIVQPIHNRTFFISQRPNGVSIPDDPNRAEYYPITYVQPYETNTAVFGLNAAAAAGRADEFATVKATGDVLIVRRLSLIQTGGYGALEYYPIFRNTNGALQLSRSDDLAGFVVSLSFAGLVLINSRRLPTTRTLS